MWLVMRSSRNWVTLEQMRTGEVLIVRANDGASVYACGDASQELKDGFGAFWVGMTAKAARRRPWEDACAEHVPDGPITPEQARDRDGMPRAVLDLIRLNRQVLDLPTPKWLNRLMKENVHA